MSEIDYAARVAKGVALLDEKRPGWEREIDLGRLDIQHGDRCVTAQLSGVGSWYTGMEQLDLTSGNDGTYVAHGFNAEDAPPEGVEGYDQFEAYGTLNALWREVIEGRLSAD
jgi:hypothetical protein